MRIRKYTELDYSDISKRIAKGQKKAAIARDYGLSRNTFESRWIRLERNVLFDENKRLQRKIKALETQSKE